MPNLPKAHFSSKMAACFAAVLLSAGSGTAASFVDATSEANLAYLQWDVDPQVRADLGVMTGGAAVADYDNDGWSDLFVTRLDGTDILFRNQGDGTFEEVSTFGEVAATNGAAWGDIDNDGDPDLYVSTVGPASSAGQYYLYVNDGAELVDRSEEYGAALHSSVGHHGFSVGFTDYDRDGLLDIHTCEWLPQGGNAKSTLLRNSGPPNFFTDVTTAAGVDMWWPEPSGGNLGVNIDAFTAKFADMDADGWQDLVVAGDFGTSQLFWNNRDGTFSLGTVEAGIGGDENGMGLAIGDYDGDGLLDIFVTSIYDERDTDNLEGNWKGSGNRLYRNRGDRTFEDVTDAAGVRNGGWGWGATFFDYDNDADLDLVMTNGYFTSSAESEFPFHDDRTTLWRNDGGVFTDVSVAEGITDTGSGKGLLVFDYDKDGDLDLFLTNNAGQPVLYKNIRPVNRHWLRVVTVGSVSNRDGIGARVTVEPRGAIPSQVREVSGGSQYLSQNEKVCHFGLGSFAAAVSKVTIEWPSGIRQEYLNVPIDTVLTATEPPSHYDGWQRLEFTPEELNEPSVCSALADPDDDGLTNLIEFALGTPARIASSESHLFIEREVGTNHMKVSFRRRQFLGEVELDLQASGNLQTWRPALNDFEEVSVETSSDGFETVTLRSVVEVPTISSLKYYLRLRASISTEG